MTMYCCEQFAKDAGAHRAFAGGGFMYPAELHPNAQFERDEDGTWCINGCCGGGCFVVTNMRFCPYCGSKLSGEEKHADK